MFVNGINIVVLYYLIYNPNVSFFETVLLNINQFSRQQQSRSSGLHYMTELYPLCFESSLSIQRMNPDS